MIENNTCDAYDIKFEPGVTACFFGSLIQQLHFIRLHTGQTARLAEKIASLSALHDYYWKGAQIRNVQYSRALCLLY